MTRKALVFTNLLAYVVVWVACFSRSSEFGLYEDDIVRIGWSFRAPFDTYWSFVWEMVTNPNQGRPLHDITIWTLSFITGRFSAADTSTLYVVGFLMVCFNVALFSTLLWRLYPNALVVGSATMSFGLYSSDTTTAFLTHCFGLQPSTASLLIGFHLYLSGHRRSSYLFGLLGCMLLYEPLAPLFLTAPLMVEDRNQRRYREHLLACCGLGVLILSLRALMGSARLEELPANPLLASIKAMILGPVVNVCVNLVRPITYLDRFDTEELVWSSLCTLLFWTGLKFCFKENSEETSYHFAFPWSLSMLCLAYSIMLVVPPTAIDGRDSRVHFAAQIPYAVFFGFSLLFLHSRLRPKFRSILLLIVAFHWGGQVSFHLQVQDDYRRAQRIQRAYLSEVFRLAPDVQEGDWVVAPFPEDFDHQETLQIFPISWATPYIFQIMLENSGWGTPPKLCILPEPSRKVVKLTESDLSIPSLVGPSGVHPGKKTILLDWSPDGELVRLTSDDIELPLKRQGLPSRCNPGPLRTTLLGE